MNQRTEINYFIPSDGDDESHPNVYYINKNIDNIKLVDIRKVYHEEY